MPACAKPVEQRGGADAIHLNSGAGALNGAPGLLLQPLQSRGSFLHGGHLFWTFHALPLADLIF